ncbi:MAG: hypothetical protein E6Q97_35565 [Desulfurellales bacterium]|nr:MAG: hypothetical protein E6Q97_35565 [Desulfurellales bacterium]
MKRVELNLPGGATAQLRPVSFAAWRQIRTSLIGLLSQKVVSAVAAVADGPLMAAVRKELANVEAARFTGTEVPVDTLALLRAALDELGRGTLETIGEILSDVVDTLADLADEFTWGCIDPPHDDLDEGEMPALDFMMLRDKAFEISEPATLLEREKNFVRGVSDVLVKLIGTSSTPRGGSASST